MSNNNKISQIQYSHNGVTTYNLGNYTPVKFLEIRTIPGTQFELIYYSGDSTAEGTNSGLITIDHSGVYKLDCNNIALHQIIFTEKSLEIIDNMQPQGYLIMTMT